VLASVVRLGSRSCSLYRVAARTGVWDLPLSLVETSQLRDSGGGDPRPVPRHLVTEGALRWVLTVLVLGAAS